MNTMTSTSLKKENDLADLFYFVKKNFVKITLVAIIFYSIFAFYDYRKLKNQSYYTDIYIYSLTNQSLYPYKTQIDNAFNVMYYNLSSINKFFSYIVSGSTNFKSDQKFEISDEMYVRYFMEIDSINLFDEFYFILKSHESLRNELLKTEMFKSDDKNIQFKKINSLLKSLNLKVSLSQKFESGRKSIRVRFEHDSDKPTEEAIKHTIQIIDTAIQIHKKKFEISLREAYEVYVDQLDNIEPSIRTYAKILFFESSPDQKDNASSMNNQINELLSLVQLYKGGSEPKKLFSNSFLQTFKPIQTDYESVKVKKEKFTINYFFVLFCFILSFLVFFIISIDRRD